MTDINLTPVREHLQRQLDSVSLLLNALDEQEKAIRQQDVTAVMAATTSLQSEKVRRVRLEQEREVLLGGLAIRMGCAPDQVTASGLAALDPDGLGDEVRRMSEQLSDQVKLLQRRHQTVQHMLESELAFVHHLLKALNPADAPAGYGRDGQQPAPQARPSVNVAG